VREELERGATAYRL
ncbi:MAG: hypothetical protein ACLRSY_09455, partial [Acutalibacter sp.]